jgi:FeS assembly SUF system protein
MRLFRRKTEDLPRGDVGLTAAAASEPKRTEGGAAMPSRPATPSAPTTPTAPAVSSAPVSQQTAASSSAAASTSAAVEPGDSVASNGSAAPAAPASDPTRAAVAEGPPDAKPPWIQAPGGGTVAPGQEPLRDAIVEVLRTVYDPEIPVNIYEIGLIYQLDVDAEGKVGIRMTLTSPMCPVAETLPPEVETKIAGVAGVRDVKLDLVWDPPWTPSMMSEEARLLLNIL